MAPDYADTTMWVRAMGDTAGTGADIFYVVSTWEVDWTTDDSLPCHYADVYNPLHQEHMHIEQEKVAAYMGIEHNFYAPLYRHTTIEAFTSHDEQLISERYGAVSWQDVQTAFRYFIDHRDPNRPFVLAGFSQGGLSIVELIRHMDDATYQQMVAAYVMGYKVTPQDITDCKRFRAARGATDTGVTICYNTVKDAKYIVDVIASPCAMCINPVNWHTDATPAVIHDTITITVDTVHHVLIAENYAATEYRPFADFINVGDIHSCEPWLYSECIRRNINDRVAAWRNKNSN